MVGRSPPPTARLRKATPPDCEGPAAETAHRLRASDPRPNPVVPLVDSPGFLPDSSRFDRDFLGTEHARREQASRHDKARWERAQGEAHARDLVRQSAAQSIEARERYLQLTGGAKSNQSGDSFDILTLQYHNTPSGYHLQKQDEAKKDRAARRSVFIHHKQHPLPYNIITGQPNPDGLLGGHGHLLKG